LYYSSKAQYYWSEIKFPCGEGSNLEFPKIFSPFNGPLPRIRASRSCHSCCDVYVATWDYGTREAGRGTHGNLGPQRPNTTHPHTHMRWWRKVQLWLWVGIVGGWWVGVAWEVLSTSVSWLWSCGGGARSLTTAGQPPPGTQRNW